MMSIFRQDTSRNYSWLTLSLFWSSSNCSCSASMASFELLAPGLPSTSVRDNVLPTELICALVSSDTFGLWSPESRCADSHEPLAFIQSPVCRLAQQNEHVNGVTPWGSSIALETTLQAGRAALARYAETCSLSAYQLQDRYTAI